VLYFDTCALVKLVRPETESAALQTWLTQYGSMPKITSALTEVELSRAVRRAAPDTHPRVRPLLAGFFKFDIDEIVRGRAASYADPMLRSLDAIHLATAEEVRADLVALVTYDDRLAAAAKSLGLPVEMPR
jgi:uncharacterized protein